MILIGHPEFYDTLVGEKEYPFKKTFTWNAAEVTDFTASTAYVRDFNNAYGDENYRIYELK